jgi:hypothetical protein
MSPVPPIPPQVLKPILHSSGHIITWGMKKALTPSSLKQINFDAALEIDVGQSGDDFVILTNAQIEEISNFLADPAVVSLARLHFIGILAPPDIAAAIDEVADFPQFQGMVESWCAEHSQTWTDLAENLWFEIDRNQKLLLSNLRKSRVLKGSDTDALLGRFFFSQFDAADPPEYIKLINELAQNPSRQQQINDLLRECDRQTRIPATDEFLVLGLEQDRAKFNDLYVDRDLIDAVSGEAISASQRLDVQGTCPRVLIIGEPGVGKSTLMSWVKWKILTDSKDAVPPVIVTLVSRYDLTSPSSSITSAIIQQFRTQFFVDCDEKTLAYLLSIGWLTLIVDGVDEILDATHRRRIVDQLNVLAQKYPALPIISTTRQTGFEIGHFRAPTFDVLQLQQYSPEQVQSYVQKWFANSKTSLKSDRFLGEIRTLGDLAQNPLLLALLCTLYRQYDYIPESRRDLYLRCASLMFYEWDPRRGIAIPNLFKREGETILRDIAFMLMHKGGVTSTIGEDQLVILVRKHLEDRGLEPMAASAAAQELLDYCSKHAWIITKTGSVGGVNQFSFTHRTFFEFFASEAIIRNLNHQHAMAYATPSRVAHPDVLGPVSREIFKAFEADHTSVMPELLLQAADDLMGGMSTTVLDELRRMILHASVSKRSSIISLCIRLIAAGGANSVVVERIFDEASKVWANSLTVSDSRWPVTDFRSLLDVSVSYRTKFIARCTADKSGLGRYFLQGYSRIGVIGEAGLYGDEWRDCAAEIVKKRLDPDPEAAHDPFEIKYRYLIGKLSLNQALKLTHGPDLLMLRVEDYAIKGVLWEAISEMNNLPSSVCDRAYANLFNNGSKLGDLSSYLSNFIETAHAAERRLIPFKLAVLIAAMVWPANLAQLAKATGTYPELLALEMAFQKYDKLHALFISEKDDDRNSAIKRRLKGEADHIYHELVKERPPPWISPNLDRREY